MTKNKQKEQYTQYFITKSLYILLLLRFVYVYLTNREHFLCVNEYEARHNCQRKPDVINQHSYFDWDSNMQIVREGNENGDIAIMER